MRLLALAVVTVNIDAGIAASRLTDFGDQTKAQTLFNYEIMKQYRTNAVHGTMDMFAVLDRMLEGTPLKYEYVNKRTVTITADSGAPIRATTRVGIGLTAQLIEDGCSFGLIPSELASEQLGDVPGACWCCTSYDDSIQDAGRQREAFCVSLPSPNACSAYQSPHRNFWSNEAINEVAVSAPRDSTAGQGDQPEGE